LLWSPAQLFMTICLGLMGVVFTSLA